MSNWLILTILICHTLFFSRSANAEPTIVTCFGDSITAGWEIYSYDGNGCTPPCGGYQPALQEILRSAGHDILLRNYGVNGELSRQGVNRIDSVLIASKPKYVLLMEGTNDALFYSPSTIQANLAFMVERAIAENAIPILGTITPDSRYNKPITTINSLLIQLAQNRGIGIADHYTAVFNDWSSLNSDGIHPNTAGYAKMASSWSQQFHPPAQPRTLTFLIKCLQVVAGLIPSDIESHADDINNDGKIGLAEAIDALIALSRN